MHETAPGGGGRARDVARALARHLLPAAAGLLVGCAGGDERGGSEAQYDVVLYGGTVVDGSGSPPIAADLGIRNGRIVRIDTSGIDPGEAVESLDARGLIVSPGFVDHHAHIGTSIHERPLAENFLYQGITTILASLHSGAQPYPLAEYAGALQIAPNIGFFAGHGWIRQQVLDMEDRAPTPAELDRMKAYVEEAMIDGALGLSTGLLYVPGNFAGTEEIAELARVAAAHGGIYSSHMRDEGRGLIESVREVIHIAEAAAIPAQVQHHKAMGVAQFGWSRHTLALIDSARSRGLDVKHDVYPYTAGSTGSNVLFPQWALAGGRDSLRVRLNDPATRARIERDMRDIHQNEWTGGDLRRIQFRVLPADPRYDGRTMADMAKDRGLPNDLDTGVQLSIELQLAGGFSAIYHIMDEQDVVRIMQHPWAMFQTDGDPIGYGRGFPHPRSYGAFPRVLARYVREQGTLTLTEAIRRMTSMSMEQIGQQDRGSIRVGMWADVLAFDYERLADLATYADPHRYSVGMVHVLVNGVPVIRDGSLTGEKPGRVLRGPARADRVAGRPSR